MKVLIITLILLSGVVNNSFAQEDETSNAQLAQYKEFLRENYKNASAERIWHDYIEVRPHLGLDSTTLASSAEKFKEPFSSWAAEEIIKQPDLYSSELATFLVGYFDNKYKKQAYEKYINRSAPPTIQVVDYGVPQENYILMTIRRLAEMANYSDLDNETRKLASSYKAGLIEHMIKSGSFRQLSNDILMELLKYVPSSQAGNVAQAIIDNDPSSFYYLDNVAGAEIPYYSELARQMLESLRIQHDYKASVMYDFLNEKIRNWPK